MKTIACKDMGMNCPYVAKGGNVDEAIKTMLQHHEKSHMNELKKMRDMMDDNQIKDKWRENVKNG